MRNEKCRKKGVLVVSTLFENLGPLGSLGLWVNVLAGGLFKY